MTTVLLIIHLIVAAALVTVVLMQRSEGGALGIGGGPGGMMSGRGAASLLTRVTMILCAVFIGNSILLAIVSGVDSSGRSVFDEGRGTEQTTDLPFDFDGEEPGEAEAPAAEETPAVPDEPSSEEESPEVPGR
ncbi:preprotein translocase subunit SecG [Marinicauda salina]|uniref:Protein-export membrane protein SecG n=1 Tax=Marinicauda salina TaxID=2135793 RepID=A0A2U2BT89_9PROT|nr:preprotein translocase subunit SecG [Marinicauda salina]PWE17223.1 preprotein translocase subunit SecG [Marinicauda salina]